MRCVCVLVAERKERQLEGMAKANLLNWVG